jgi:hypothetical protein
MRHYSRVSKAVSRMAQRRGWKAENLKEKLMQSDQ